MTMATITIVTSIISRPLSLLNIIDVMIFRKEQMPTRQGDSHRAATTTHLPTYLPFCLSSFLSLAPSPAVHTTGCSATYGMTHSLPHSPTRSQRSLPLRSKALATAAPKINNAQSHTHTHTHTDKNSNCFSFPKEPRHFTTHSVGSFFRSFFRRAGHGQLCTTLACSTAYCLAKGLNVTPAESTNKPWQLTLLLFVTAQLSARPATGLFPPLSFPLFSFHPSTRGGSAAFLLLLSFVFCSTSRRPKKAKEGRRLPAGLEACAQSTRGRGRGRSRCLSPSRRCKGREGGREREREKKKKKKRKGWCRKKRWKERTTVRRCYRSFLCVCEGDDALEQASPSP